MSNTFEPAGLITDIADGLDYVRQYAFGGAQVSSWTADGVVNITLNNSAGVNTGYGTQLNQVQLILNGAEWMDVSTTSGTIVPGDSMIVDVYFFSLGFDGGLYTTDLNINTNDPANPLVVISCEMNVLYNVCPDFESVTAECNGFTEFFDMSANTPTNWLWDFGDGSTSTVQNPTHSYANAGIYTVNLVACNAFGCDSIAYQVNVSSTNGPVVASCTPQTLFPLAGYGIQNVSFNTINNGTNGSTEGYMDYTCTISTNVMESTSYSLDVITYTTENVKVWIDYNNDGVFDILEEVMNSASNTVHSATVVIPGTAVLGTPLRMRVGSDYFTSPTPDFCTDTEYGQFEDYVIYIESATAPPVSMFDHAVLDPCFGYIQFNDLSLNGPTSWLWYFGDGDSSDVQNPSHSYVSSGIYTVTMIAANTYGADTSFSLVTIDYLEPTIIIPDTVMTNVPVYFTTDETNISWSVWDFGDGGSSNLNSPTYTYLLAGTYVVIVDVTDGNGCTAQDTTTIVVINNTGINAPASQTAVAVYPNPNNGMFTLQMSQFNTEDVLVRITDVLGKQLYLDKLQDVVSLKEEINLRNLSPGVYYVNISTSKEDITKMILIEK